MPETSLRDTFITFLLRFSFCTEDVIKYVYCTVYLIEISGFFFNFVLVITANKLVFCMIKYLINEVLVYYLNHPNICPTPSSIDHLLALNNKSSDFVVKQVHYLPTYGKLYEIVSVSDQTF